ncbi:MAG: hypothetical protein JO121_31940 [Deltaproteobacteria bacterium]|nr:hypothetical protein [Deltaproteobacteria bacterium]
MGQSRQDPRRVRHHQSRLATFEPQPNQPDKFVLKHDFVAPGVDFDGIEFHRSRFDGTFQFDAYLVDVFVERYIWLFRRCFIVEQYLP